MVSRVRVGIDDLQGDGLIYRFARMLYASVLSVLMFVDKGRRRYRYAFRKSRYINAKYYSKYKNLEFPQGRKWVLITLTLSRDIDLITAWSSIGGWVSRFLHNLRTHFYRKGVKVPYFWVIEPHRDGYPHVHILIAFPFLPLERLQRWWSYSEDQGVDVRFIGGDYKQVKGYVLKYLVKSQYVDFSVRAGYIEFGLVPFLLWACRVRLLGRSRALILGESKREKEWLFVGIASFYDDVVEDVKRSIRKARAPCREDELEPLLVSFLQQSGIVFNFF